MADLISIEALVKYEEITGKNGREMLSKVSDTITDLRDRAFVIKYTSDQTVTIESITKLTFEELAAILASVAPKKTDATTPTAS